MTTSATTPTTIEEIVDGLKDHVWVLLRAGHVNAAMALLADSIEDYLRIVAEVDSIDAGRHAAPSPDEAEEVAAPEASPEGPEPEVEDSPVTVEVVEVADIPEDVPGPPVALLVEVDEGETWQIPLQSSAGTTVMLRERS